MTEKESDGNMNENQRNDEDKYEGVVISCVDGVNAVYNKETKRLVKTGSEDAYKNKEKYSLKEEDFED